MSAGLKLRRRRQERTTFYKIVLICYKHNYLLIVLSDHFKANISNKIFFFYLQVISLRSNRLLVLINPRAGRLKSHSFDYYMLPVNIRS